MEGFPFFRHHEQIDAGQWPELRLDLAALERELGQLLDQASQTLT